VLRFCHGFWLPSPFTLEYFLIKQSYKIQHYFSSFWVSINSRQAELLLKQQSLAAAPCSWLAAPPSTPAEPVNYLIYVFSNRPGQLHPSTAPQQQHRYQQQQPSSCVFFCCFCSPEGACHGALSTV
jgi:hypothetical protein